MPQGSEDPTLTPCQNSEVGPLLLNPAGDLDPRVKAEITRVLGTPQTPSTNEGYGKPGILQSITILGDTSEISADAETQLQAMGYYVARVDPADVVAYSTRRPQTTPGVPRPFTPLRHTRVSRRRHPGHRQGHGAGLRDRP